MVYFPNGVAVIINGVPRTRRDGDEHRVAAYLASARTKDTDERYKAFAESKPTEVKPPPPLPQPAPEPPPSAPRHRVRCTVRRPDPDKNEPGQIIEASYTITGNLLRVYDDGGRELGTATLQPGDDAEAAARRILREKHGPLVLRSDQLSL